VSGANNAIRNARIANTSRALKRGELKDPEFEKLINDLEDYVCLEQMGGDYFYLTGVKDKKDNANGLIGIKAYPRSHGDSESPLSINSILKTQLYHEGGGVSLVSPPSKELAIEEAKKLISKYVQEGSISKLGKGGARSKRTPEELLEIAASTLVDTDRGYNSTIGYAYGGLGLDQGHKISHVGRPDLSNNPNNLEMEIQYANKAKSATEKKAGKEGRVPTDAELAQGLLKSFINKITSDVTLPDRRTLAGRAEYEALMNPINAKVNEYMASLEN